MKTKVVFLFILIFFVCLSLSNTSYASTKVEGINNFPTSYQPYLQELKKKYPNWSFVALYTGQDWNIVINSQVKYGVSLVPISYSDGWKNTAPGVHNVVVDAGWVNASRRAVEYAMDPRNFLNEVRIFQFETLSYDAAVNTKDGVEKVLYGTEFYDRAVIGKKYSDLIMDAAVTSKVSSYHLASRIKQEVGPFLSHSSISGTVAGYEGLYNFYNIGATSHPDYMQVIKNGLQYAKDGKGATQETKDKYLIPWTDQAKSIKGGAIFIGSSYINVGQNTIYLQKFDVNDEKPGELFWHQYMTNILAPYSEAKLMYNGYLNSNMLNLSMSFIIPVYNNMPELQIQRPDIPDSDYITDSTRVYADVTGNVNVRTGPSTTYEILTTITRDDVLTRVGKGVQAGELWDKVILPNGMFGYVFQSYFKELPSEPEKPVNIPVSDVTLDKDRLIILKDSNATLFARIVPLDATNQKVLWESSDDDIAIVDQNGKITGINKGNAQIIVKTEDGGKTTICDVTVTELSEEQSYTIENLRVEGDKIANLDLSNLSVGKIKESILTDNLNVTFLDLQNAELKDEDSTGTGTRVIITDVDNNVISEYTLVIYGDVDGDGQITSVDLLRLQRHILEISVLDPIFELAGNTAKNGLNPTSVDLLRIQRHILELQLLTQ